MRPSHHPRRPAVLSAADLHETVSRIGAMTIEQLRAEWRAVRKVAPSPGLSKDVMARELTYRLQERALGGLAPEIRRMLRLAGQGDDRERRMKQGSLIVREHQGVLHEVTVVAGGFSWHGKTYASLSKIARLITGTSWNGPRFFGLRAKRKACAASTIQPAHRSSSVTPRGRQSSVASNPEPCRVPSSHEARHDADVGDTR